MKNKRKVYLVGDWPQYESSIIYGIYTSKQKAEKRVKELTEKELKEWPTLTPDIDYIEIELNEDVQY